MSFVEENNSNPSHASTDRLSSQQHHVPIMSTNHNMNERILHEQVDWLYEFKESQTFSQYIFHRTKRLSFHSIGLLGILLTCFVIPVQFLFVIADIQSGQSSMYYVERMILSFCLLLSSISCLISIIYLTVKKVYYTRAEKLVVNEISTTAVVDSPMSHTDTDYSCERCSILFSICAQIYFVCIFLRRCLRLDCFVDLAYVNMLGGSVCYDIESLELAVSYNACILLIIPVILFIAVSNISVRIVWLNFCVSIVVILVIAWKHSIIQEVILQSILILLLCVASIADIQYSRILDYVFSKEILWLYSTLAEVREDSLTKFKEDMRMLIGNVAHDIKSPLTSFLTGLDYIDRILAEVGQSTTLPFIDTQGRHAKIDTSSASVSSTLLVEQIQDIHSCVHSLRSIYSMILAVVNRCSEYCKITSDMQLTPRKQTISLRTTVARVIDMVDSIGTSSIQIIWKVINEDSPKGNHLNDNLVEEEGGDILLNTDIQWLEENLLCVLANAIKYSNNHSVILTITNHTINHSAHRKGTVKFSICDEGVCLNDQELDVFFNVNYIDDKASAGLNIMQCHGGGIGLGLFTLAKRIECLGGEYGVSNRIDGKQGIEVWFNLPIERESFLVPVPKKILFPTLATAKEDMKSNDQKTIDTRDAAHTIEKTVSVKFQYSHSCDGGTPPQHRQKLIDCSPVSISSRAVKMVPDPLTFLPTIPIYHHTKKHVLIVDDSSSILKMLSMMFRKQGYRVSTAMNGKAAVDIVKGVYDNMKRKNVAVNEESCHIMDNIEVIKEDTELIDVILMDIQMPIMNGYEAIKAIRAIEKKELSTSPKQEDSKTPSNNYKNSSINQHIFVDEVSGDNKVIIDNNNKNTVLVFPSICIIAMSANSEYATTQEALEAGANAFLNKPFSFHEFQCLIPEGEEQN